MRITPFVKLYGIPMNTSKLVRSEGVLKVKKEINQLEKKLKDILTQKGEAYESGGNAWHDNPSFDDLSRQEEVTRLRIGELKNFLNTADVIDQNKTKSQKTNHISIGDEVTVMFENGKKNTYTIAGLMESDPCNKIISCDSPLAKAILGGSIGEEKTFSASGLEKKVKILEIEHKHE